MVKPTHLLDTAAFLWAVVAPEQLSKIAREILADRDTTPAISVASLMELIIKVRRGKLVLAPDPVEWWNQQISALDVAVLPLKQSHVEGCGRFRSFTAIRQTGF